ncbi:Aspartyl-tRNA(Asn) amidotransferase subunit A [Labilithrix luteola]|uniref:Aspartyl-tRNA(Asn) amidotransferase subunit A n=1 Tax=Labilithrix luteola TaxID=1391654 RepID=A0A0K1Q091_9BACT|nr:amidase [Labilithrix luteola]AKU99200.1 Aspartyl-tRNA(Asn) amidotransferase subunit A [Labilithrix luteola]
MALREPMLYDGLVPSPRLSGTPLRSLARLSKTRVGSRALQRMLRGDLGVDRLAELPEALRGDVPLDTRPHPGRAPRDLPSEGLPITSHGWAESSASLTAAYRNGQRSPYEVARKVLDEARRLARLSPSVGPVCDFSEESALADAQASAARWRLGRALGPLDGVPMLVKEQTAVKGLPRRSGTTFLDGAPQENDATAVARMRAAGAIVIGTTVMTELGMTPNGSNAKRVMPRNPHDTNHIAGGSSTGSGVAVATGLVPFAIGADGGGSIRIPSAMNGVFGIKPTWGRVSRSGDVSTGTVAHLGPIAGCTLDLAHMLELMSGHDANDPQTFAAPPRERGSFISAIGRGVRGLVIGVPESEWADASEPVARAGKAALSALEKAGAKLVPVRLELASYAMSIGVVIIAAEARASVREDWRTKRDEMGDDLQVTFSAIDGFEASEYLDVCRLRTGLRHELSSAFRTIDLLALPSTVSPAARVTDTDMRTGFLDTKVLDGLCRFAFLGNLSGLPALSAPVGCDANGLPLGLQLVGDAWDEATVFAAAGHLERLGVALPRRPRVTADL